MRRRRRVGSLVALVVSAATAAGCGHVPENASKSTFCSAGEKFSALDKVTFAQGQEAIDRLADVGTPEDIGSSARSGFVELIDRMKESDDAAEFRRATRTMSPSERKHLLDLDTYIQATCSDRVPLGASDAEFCAAGKKFAAAQAGTDFTATRATVKALASIGTPEAIGAPARTGFIELIDRVENAYDATDLEQRTAAMTAEQRTNLEALDTYIKKTCS